MVIRKRESGVYITPGERAELARRDRWENRSAPKPCDNPRKSEAPGVCVCGAALGRHKVSVDYMPYHQAVWAWLLENGAVPSYYGGVDQRDTLDVLAHLKYCEIDYTKTRQPELTNVAMFNGTFASSSAYETRMLGYITCKCGDLWQQDWGLLNDMTLSEIIFQVIQKGKVS